ncbi:MAG: FdtA/QdtA family cupin domain-containing protein [Crocinitomicaceae bacterium]|nr:FdtA/QdtA family cupin domain-containing protein [Crocinitomicaceae bacterium]
MELSRISLLSFPKISDERGNLTYIQYFDHIPFEIKRVYWLYDVPSGQTRGGHAFKLQNEVVIALSGSFQVYLTDGISEETYLLNRPNQGLYIPKMTWRQFRNFSTNTVVLIITSDLFNEEDYINDFSIFKTYN